MKCYDGFRHFLSFSLQSREVASKSSWATSKNNTKEGAETSQVLVKEHKKREDDKKRHLQRSVKICKDL